MARSNIHTVPSSSISELIGIQNIVNVTNPGAGNQFTYKLPGGYYYRLIGGSFTLTTSAAAANRVVVGQYTDGVNVLTGFGASLNVTANTVQPVMLGTVGAANASGLGSLTILTLPQVWLSAGYVIQSNILNMQAGDTLTAVVLWLEQLDYGALGEPEASHPATGMEAAMTEPLT